MIYTLINISMEKIQKEIIKNYYFNKNKSQPWIKNIKFNYKKIHKKKLVKQKKNIDKYIGYYYKNKFYKIYKNLINRIYETFTNKNIKRGPTYDKLSVLLLMSWKIHLK